MDQWTLSERERERESVEHSSLIRMQQEKSQQCVTVTV